MTTPDWLGGAAVLGLLAGGWGYIKSTFSRVVSLLVVTVNIRGETAAGFIIFANKNMSRLFLGNRSFGSRHRYIRPLKKHQHIVDEKLNLAEPVIFRLGSKIIVMQAPDPKQLKEIGELETKDSQIRLRFIRGTWKIDDLLMKCIQTYNDTMAADRGMDANLKKRFFTYRYVGAGNKTIMGQDAPGTYALSCSILLDAQTKFPHWRHEDVGVFPESKNESMSSLAFPPEIKSLVTEIVRWKESGEWYIEKNIPWQRGWLLYGPPGNGKTSLVRAIGQDTDMPVLTLDLSSMSNSELVECWRKSVKYSPCIILIEDIDAVFHGRENITGLQGGGVTFDCLLNCFNGVEPNNGVFIVVSTNFVDKVDPAIGRPVGEHSSSNSTRPGRIDRAIELRNPDAQCRRQIAEKILGEWPAAVEAAMAESDDSYSAAQFQEKCVQKALSLYWNDWHPPLKLVG